MVVMRLVGSTELPRISALTSFIFLRPKSEPVGDSDRMLNESLPLPLRTGSGDDGRCSCAGGPPRILLLMVMAPLAARFFFLKLLSESESWLSSFCNLVLTTGGARVVDAEDTGLVRTGRGVGSSCETRLFVKVDGVAALDDCGRIVFLVNDPARGSGAAGCADDDRRDPLESPPPSRIDLRMEWLGATGVGSG